MLYLVKHYDTSNKLWSTNEDEQAQIMQWLFFQSSGVGVIQGQAVWFSKYHAEKLPSAIERYVNELKRVLGVLEIELSKPENKGWLVGDRITVAVS